jgi:hypothetical protein
MTMAAEPEVVMVPIPLRTGVMGVNVRTTRTDTTFERYPRFAAGHEVVVQPAV